MICRQVSKSRSIWRHQLNTRPVRALSDRRTSGKQIRGAMKFNCRRIVRVIEILIHAPNGSSQLEPTLDRSDIQIVWPSVYRPACSKTEVIAWFVAMRLILLFIGAFWRLLRVEVTTRTRPSTTRLARRHLPAAEAMPLRS
jgi:hypothetical protein